MLKNSKYRLQIVVEQRERSKTDALNFVGLCRQNLELEQSNLKICQDNVQKCRARQQSANLLFLKEADKLLTANRLAQFKIFSSELRNQASELQQLVVEQQENVKKSENELDAALENLTKVTKELKAIERHKEKWLEQRRLAVARKEQKFNDEIGMILFQRRRVENNQISTRF